MDIVRATPLHLMQKFLENLSERILMRNIVPKTTDSQHQLKIPCGKATIYLTWGNPDKLAAGSYHLDIQGPTKDMLTPQAVWYVPKDHPLWNILDALYIQAFFYAENGNFARDNPLLSAYAWVVRPD